MGTRRVHSIFAVSALLIITGGRAMIGPLSKATTAGGGDAVSLSVEQGGSGELARTARDRG
jgi:hypothetical protein